MNSFVIFSSFFLSLNIKIISSDGNLELAEHLFVNLYNDPTLEVSEGASEVWMEYIDNKIDVFRDLMKNKDGTRHTLQRRSIKENQDMYTLEGFEPFDYLKNKSLLDADIFNRNGVYYLAGLEETGKDIKLGLYMYKNSSFEEIFKTTSNLAYKIYTKETKDDSFIITVEETKLNIYQVKEKILTKIQTINSKFVSDIYLWINNHGLFMGVARNVTKAGISHVYKWFGRHFDLIDNFQTFGASAIRGFTIGSSEFVVITNYQNEYEQKEIFSQIFKYNLQKEEYEINQNIATYGAKSVEFSSFVRNGVKDHFLFVVNSNKNEQSGNCVIYKFIDNYFMPYEILSFDNIEKIFIIPTPNQDNIIGLQSKTQGLKIYSYDGFVFNEILIHESKKPKILNFAKKIAKLDTTDILMIQNQNALEMVEIIFEKEHYFLTVEDGLFNWCQVALEQIKPSARGIKKIEEAISADDVDRITGLYKGGYFNGKSAVSDDEIIDKLKSMNEELMQELQNLNQIDEKISNSISSTPDKLIINHNLYIEELTLKGSIIFEDLITDNINNIKIDEILENKIDLEASKPNQLDNFEFDDVLIETLPEFLNGKPSISLLDYDNMKRVERIIIDGNVSVRNDVEISGFLNDFKITKSNIFVNGIEQIFDYVETTNCTVNKIKIDGLINNQSCHELYSVEIRELNNLTVNNLDILNNLNGIKFETIKNNSLKSRGDQKLTKSITFNTLITEEIVIDNLNISHYLDDTLHFNDPFKIRDLHIKQLEITNNMNDIKVENGTLSVLRKNITREQEIKGNKIFGVVNITSGTSNMNKDRIIDRLVIPSDVNISGTVFVENLIKAENLKSPNCKFGVSDIKEEGIKLDEEEIGVLLKFPSITVNNINTKEINYIPVNDYIKINDDFQVIIGNKTIQSDLYINGTSQILKINNVSIEGFKESVLNVFGDQTINGTYYITNITANTVTSENVKLENTPFEDLSPNNSNINNTIIIDSLKIKRSFIDNINLNKMNGIEIKPLLNDILRNETELFGNKTVRKIYAKNVYNNNKFNMDDLPNLLKAFKTNVQFDDRLKINEIRAENVNINEFINDIQIGEFMKAFLETPIEHEFKDAYFLHNVTILGKTFVENNHLNHLRLDDLFVNTVKIDEDNSFEEAVFDGLLMISGTVVLYGNIVGLDLNSALTFSNKTEVIFGDKTFQSTVFVNGSLEFKNKVNGLNLKNMCTSMSNNNYDLVINGNVIFHKDLQVKALNNFPISDILKNKWMRNQEGILKGYIKFENISLQNDVYLKGLINGIKLENFVENYFSKSKNQTIPSTMDFTENIKFLNGLRAKEMLLEDSISGLRLNDIIGKALLDGYTQVLQDTLDAETIVITDLNGQYLLNNMNPHKQMLRYDVEGIVTEDINLSGLEVTNLITTDDLLLQNINVSKWLKEAVMKNGGLLESGYFFGDVKLSGEISAMDYVNGKKFNKETVLLKSNNQNLTGNITFDLIEPNSLHIKNLHLETLNGINLELFFKQLVSSEKKVKINSPLRTTSVINTNNIEINKLHNGVNVSSLLSNLTTFDFENFHENYSYILNVSKRVENSFKWQLAYLNYYEEVQVFDNVIYGDIFDNNLLVISYEKSYIYLLYAWDEVKHVLDLKCNKSFVNYEMIYFVDKIILGSQSYLYIEDVHFGYITRLLEDHTFEYLDKLPINSTQSLHSFEIVEKSLQCVIFISNSNTNLYCKSRDTAGFVHVQKFKGMRKVTSLVMNKETFLITSGHIFIENYITIWQYNIKYGKFVAIQNIYAASPCSVSSISFGNVHYIAIASGNIEGAIHSGLVQIKWFNPSVGLFVTYQVINIDSPVQVEFEILPSQELVLFVLKESSSLLVYEYEGIFGFNKKYDFTVDSNSLKIVSLNREHLILARGEQNLKVIRGIFKK